LIEGRDHAGGLVLAGGDDHVGAVRLQRVGGGPRSRSGDDDRQRCGASVADELGVQRQPAQRIEHDPPGLAGDAVDASGQQRVIGQRGADADDDRVAFGRQ